MRMLRRLESLEKADAAGVSGLAGRPMAVVYTQDNVRLEEGLQLQPGESVAVDVHLLEPDSIDALLDPKRIVAPPPLRIVERVTTNADDTGGIFESGRCIGKVHPTARPYLDLEFFGRGPKR